MSQSDNADPFYQFPLSLLQLWVRGDIDRGEFVQRVVSWTLVDSGKRWFENLHPDHQSRVDSTVQRLNQVGQLPEDFDPEDERHLTIARMNEKLDLNLGAMAPTVERYRKVKKHRDEYLSMLDGNAGDTSVRLRSDLVWTHLNEEQMGKRRFRVLAGLYAGIGGSRYYRISYDWLRYLSAGYKSESAYESVVQHRHGRMGGPAFGALDLPAPPTAFVKGQNARDEGFFRYDGARAYWEQHPSGVPFMGPDGMFEATLTTRWALFELREEYFPADGSAPTTGRTDPSELFEEGERVIFEATDGDDIETRSRADGRRRLELGTIEEIKYNNLVIAGDDGRTYEVARGQRRPAPTRLFEEQIEAAKEAGSNRESRELLTRDQVRYTRNKLLDTKWLTKYSNGRHSYYSNSLSRQEIAEAVENDQTERLERRVEEEKAKLDAKKKNAALRNQLEELRKANREVGS